MILGLNNNPYQYYTVKLGDTISLIASKYNLDYKMLLALNGLEENDYIYPNQTIFLPKEGVSLYLTEENGTIHDLSEKLGMSEIELLENNENIFLRENQIIVY